MAQDSGLYGAMTREELLERASGLVPVLRERSALSEAARSCPAETVEDFRRNGLLRVCQPARYGGLELGWDVLAELAQTLARGCASQAWSAMILNDHCQLLGSFPVEAQDDVWGEKPDTFLSASLDPIGKARRVARGVVYSGRHSFSSGIDHVQWVICGGRIDGDEHASYFVVPKGDIKIIDDWQVMGLSGTGSKSFLVEDVFVPEHRIIDVRAVSEDGTGSGTLVNRAPVYRLPRAAAAPLVFAGLTVGIAEGFIEEYCRYTRPRKSRGIPIADLMGTQIAVGRATAEVEAASRLNLATVREAMATAARGELLHERQEGAGALQRRNRGPACARFGDPALQHGRRTHPLPEERAAAGDGYHGVKAPLQLSHRSVRTYRASVIPPGGLDSSCQHDRSHRASNPPPCGWLLPRIQHAVRRRLLAAPASFQAEESRAGGSSREVCPRLKALAVAESAQAAK